MARNQGQFKNGNIPWNKNISFDAGGRSILTRFKPGNVPPNRKPVGTMRKNTDGYWEIKIEPGKYKYRLLHRVIWQSHHKMVPPKGTAIIFVDGNKDNLSIDNLKLVTRAELAVKNQRHNLPAELKEVIFLKRSITQKINKKNQNTR